VFRSLCDWTVHESVTYTLPANDIIWSRYNHRHDVERALLKRAKLSHKVIDCLTPIGMVHAIHNRRLHIIMFIDIVYIFKRTTNNDRVIEEWSFQISYQGFLPETNSANQSGWVSWLALADSAGLNSSSEHTCHCWTGEEQHQQQWQARIMCRHDVTHNVTVND